MTPHAAVSHTSLSYLLFLTVFPPEHPETHSRRERDSPLTTRGLMHRHQRTTVALEVTNFPSSYSSTRHVHSPIFPPIPMGRISTCLAFIYKRICLYRATLAAHPTLGSTVRPFQMSLPAIKEISAFLSSCSFAYQSTVCYPTPRFEFASFAQLEPVVLYPTGKD